ncbi:hypothetical protein H920_08336 [Fukomys damarensis]|uniref:Uncharacterized protein n=1 Tax=Fukomys damarensis TaxID=885580 RepID=A0A091DJ66_FUKDA|nr:hypothetical protein H920_08336 [Fukomys damarensis]
MFSPTNVYVVRSGGQWSTGQQSEQELDMGEAPSSPTGFKAPRSSRYRDREKHMTEATVESVDSSVPVITALKLPMIQQKLRLFPEWVTGIVLLKKPRSYAVVLQPLPETSFVEV